MTRTNESITSGQKERIAQLVIDELISLGANKDSAQRIIIKGGNLQAAVREQLLDLGALRYKDEEVESSKAYPKEFAVKPICEQLLILKNFPLFAGLDTSNALSCSKQTGGLTEGAEGLYAIPDWQKVGSSYNDAFQKVLNLLAKSRAFTNYREGEIGPKYLRLTKQTEEAYAKIRATQPGDFFIIQAQFGMLHRGRSVRRAIKLFSKNEFGLGPYEVAVMLLTHPERLVRWEQLHIDCAGAEYAPGADGVFSGAPYFSFDDSGVQFDTSGVGFFSEGYGSASGFLSQ